MSSCCGKDRLLKAIYLICKSELIKTESNKEECHEILKVCSEIHKFGVAVYNLLHLIALCALFYFLFMF